MFWAEPARFVLTASFSFEIPQKYARNHLCKKPLPRDSAVTAANKSLPQRIMATNQNCQKSGALYIVLHRSEGFVVSKVILGSKDFVYITWLKP